MKKATTILLTTAMLMGNTAFAKDYPQNFWDVSKDHWAFEYIADLAERGVIDGYDDGSFKPERTVSRAEWAKIMVDAAGVTVNDDGIYFNDMSNHWANKYVNAAMNYLTGYADGSYRPDQTAVREDVTVAMVKLKGYDMSEVDYSVLSNFTDNDSISSYAKAYVAMAISKDLINGFEDNTFRGQDTLTRAEAATLLYRAFQKGSEDKVTDLSSVASKKNSETEKPISQTESATNNPTPTPIPEPTEIPKPYVINKLASANIEDSALMTMDNDNNIYYIESDDNCVYKLDTSSGKKTKFFDINNLSLQKTEKQDVDVEEEVTETVETGEYDEVEEKITETVTEEETGEEKEVTKTVTKQVPKTKEVTKTITKTVSKDVVVEDYSDFEPYQLKYDTGIDKLFLSGKYTTLEKPYQSAKSTEYGVTYDITRKTESLLYENSKYCYGTALNSEIAHIFISTYFDNLNMVNGNITNGSNYDFYGLYEPIKMMFKTGNNIYALGFHGGYSSSSGALFKYDFASSDYKSIADTDYFNSVAQKGSNLYFWYNDEFRKMSVSDGKVTELDINTKSDNVEFADMGSMNKISEVFFVIDDNKVIFYDEAMQAFRVLQKNK